MQISERILIADRSAEFCEELRVKLELSGYLNVDTVETPEMLRYAAERSFYNVIIAEKEICSAEELDYLLHHRDGIYPFSSGAVIVTTDMHGESVSELSSDKTAYLVKRSADFQLFNRVIKELLDTQRNKISGVRARDTGASLERNVTGVMHALGIPAHIKGYQFLRTAIIKAVNDPEIINYVTKSLYPGVAKAHGTTPSRVERAIRHAIEVAWDRGDVDTLNSYFGYTISRQRGKPTNSEFIAMIADNLRIKNSENNDASYMDESVIVNV